MAPGNAFIQRMQEDAEFRQKVKACADGADRLAFLKSEGYDFTPFIQILDNLSPNQTASVRLRQPGKSASHQQSGTSLWSRITRIFHTP
jgi:hypothetical protein